MIADGTCTMCANKMCTLCRAITSQLNESYRHAHITLRSTWCTEHFGALYDGDGHWGYTTKCDHYVWMADGILIISSNLSVVIEGVRTANWSFQWTSPRSKWAALGDKRAHRIQTHATLYYTTCTCWMYAVRTHTTPLTFIGVAV